MTNSFDFEEEPFEYRAVSAAPRIRKEVRFEAEMEEQETDSEDLELKLGAGKSVALRVRIVGYASPRWRGAMG
jgi:hypothetical protein